MMALGAFGKLLALVGMSLVLANCTGSIKKSADRPAANSTSGQATQTVQPGSPVLPARPMTVAFLAPLSGDYEAIGQQLLNAASLAVFEAEPGAIEIVALDTKGDAATAREVIAGIDPLAVDFIAGPLFADHLSIVRSTPALAQTPVLSFSNRAEMAGGNVFALGVSVQAQVDRLVQHLATNNLYRVLVIGPQSPFVEEVMAALLQHQNVGNLQVAGSYLFGEEASVGDISEGVNALTQYDARRQEWSAYQSQIVPRLREAADPSAFLRQEAERFPPESIRQQQLQGLATVYRQFTSLGRNRALSETISRINGVDAVAPEDFDAVLLPFNTEKLTSVVAFLDRFNAGHPFAKLMGFSNWQDPRLTANPSLHNAQFVAVDEATLAPFDLAFQNTYQEQPIGLAVTGYFATRIALELGQAGARPFSARNFHQEFATDGLAGSVRIEPDNVIRRPLTIYEIKPEGIAPVEIAPLPTS